MLALLAASALLFSAPDPAGDANGDGSYRLPGLPPLSPATFDLRSLRAENVGGNLRISVALGAVANPWQAPSGFSGLVLDIFVKTGAGGAQTLSDLGLKVPGTSGWQEHYRFTGLSSVHTHATGQGELQVQQNSPQPQLRGTDLILDTGLKAGDYAYWVSTSVYSPFTASGVLSPGGDTSSAGLRSAREGSPAPVDVLYAGDQKGLYTSGVLPPVGQIRDLRPLALLLLSGLGLLIAVVGGVRAWRR